MAVQDLDTSIAQLVHRKSTLAERANLAKAELRLKELSAARRDAAVRRQVIADQLVELENQVAGLTARRGSIQDRMYAARGAQARDLQAMDEEIHHLALRGTELEDEELELMEAQEPIDAELEQIQAEGSQLEAATAELRAAVTAADTVIDTEVATLVATREVQAGRLPAELLDRYEDLRVKLKGTGAARLIDNHCEGCHLELPSMEVERIRRLPPEEIVTCDNCGRILVHLAKSAAL
jgi:predicted  nucleic acid-binding Zn-ribbon protein